MLAWNQRKVRQLTPVEIWLFIAGRVLVALGIGLLLASYVPALVSVGWPLVVCGSAMLLWAARGLARRARPGASPNS